MTGNASMAEQEMLEARALSDWVAVISQVATHYRLSFSPADCRPWPAGSWVNR